MAGKDGTSLRSFEHIVDRSNHLVFIGALDRGVLGENANGVVCLEKKTQGLRTNSVVSRGTVDTLLVSGGLRLFRGKEAWGRRGSFHSKELGHNRKCRTLGGGFGQAAARSV